MHKFTLLLLCLFTATSTLAAPTDSKLKQILNQLKIGQPERHKNLILYPVLGPKVSLPRVMTLDQALRAGNLDVREVSQDGDVNRVTLVNKGGVPIFVMAGEILDGAKQDRILQHDIWLPVGRRVQVGAFCVEQGRWSYDSPGGGFKSTSSMANVAVRSTARKDRAQSGVWSAVEETQEKAGYAAPTQSLNSAYDDPKTAADVSEYLKALGQMARANPEMIGVVVQVGDRVVSADVFPDRDLLLSLWKKMLKSYALEAAAESGDPKVARIGSADSLLKRARTGSLKAASASGEGRLWELSADNVTGEALMLGTALTHLELFAK